MENINKLIAQGEGISIEFKKCKSALPKNTFETVCAFLNRLGGYILLGVEDSGIVSGVDRESAPQIKKDFVSQLNNGQKISPTIYISIDECEIQEKLVLVVYVPESSQVHSTNGKIFDRNDEGDFNVSSSAEIVKAMHIRKQKEYTENEIFPFATMEDFEQKTIDLARTLAVNRQPNHPWSNLSNEELLKSAGLYKKDVQTGKSGYTLACVLLFGRQETIYSAIPHHRTDAILRKVNLDRYDDRDDIRANLFESYGRLMNFIEKHLNDMFFLEDDVRVSVRNKLFREVVSNILIHREYANAFPAKLIIGKDSVITENSNKAHGYGEIDLNDFTPFPKNPTIARVFKEVGWADELGSGIRNIKKYSKIYSHSVPTFIEGDVFKTIIKIENGDKKVAIKSGDKKTSAKTEKNILIILEHLTSEEIVSNQAISELLGIQISGTRKILAKMLADGIIVAEGKNKNRTYKLAKKR